jgi:hypothetical protein
MSGCDCGSLADDLPGQAIGTTPGMAARVTQLSRNATEWRFLYECRVCCTVWEERYERSGHGEIPSLHRLNRDSG